MHLPIIDIQDLCRPATAAEQAGVVAQISAACRSHGFFYVTGHGVSASLQERLVQASRKYFAQPLEQKLRIRMARGGTAWRGYFPVGDELTSGAPDLKEGLYFGAELEPEHPLVRAGTPLHGANLFPEGIPGFRETVLEYMLALTGLGHGLMRGIALSLGLSADYFDRQYTADPLILFRIFNYPAPQSQRDASQRWGVGEHTDYGLLTILLQDEVGGLEVKAKSGWIEAPPIAGSFVCNIGDMLDKATGGIYRSTPHRVRNASQRDRLSFPFFFDPNFNARLERIPLRPEAFPPDDKGERWDQDSVHEFTGTYGAYLLAKVGKVFPTLGRKVLGSEHER